MKTSPNVFLQMTYHCPHKHDVEYRHITDLSQEDVKAMCQTWGGGGGGGGELIVNANAFIMQFFFVPSNSRL